MKIDGDSFNINTVVSNQNIESLIQAPKKIKSYGISNVFDKDIILDKQQISSLQTYQKDKLQVSHSTISQESELLRRAMGSDRMDIVDLLIKYSNNDLGIPSTHYAVYIGDYEAVEKFLPLMQINKIETYKEGYRATSLCIASLMGHKEIYELLKNHGAIEDICISADPKGMVYSDAIQNSPNILKKMIELGKVKPTGKLLFDFLGNFKCTFEVIKILVDHGADCGYFEMDTWPKPHKVSCLTKCPAVQDARITKLLLDNGALPLINEGLWIQRPLTAALVFAPNLEVIKLLVEYGAVLDENEKEPTTNNQTMFVEMFSKIVNNNLWDVFKAVPQFIAKINTQCYGSVWTKPVPSSGSSILEKAIYANDIKMVKWLLDNKADTNKALDWAIYHKKKEIIALLIQYEAKL